MVHMPSLEIWEWGLKIFGSALTLTTHVDHLLLYHTTTNMHKLRAQTFITTCNAAGSEAMVGDTCVSSLTVIGTAIGD